MPVSVLAEADTPSVDTDHAFNARVGTPSLASLSAYAPIHDAQKQKELIVVAHNTAEKPGPGAAEKVETKRCCGDFWDVHFGGYRWAWWALAGVGLVAIHAN